MHIVDGSCSRTLAGLHSGQVHTVVGSLFFNLSELPDQPRLQWVPGNLCGDKGSQHYTDQITHQVLFGL